MTARAAALAAALAALACGGDDPASPDARIVDVRCDAEAQDCPAGSKCNPTGPALGPWDGTMCVDDNAGTGSAAGSPCFTGPDGSDTCDPLTMCLQLGTGEGVCTEYCAGDGDGVCAADELCVSFDDAVGVTLCALACDGPDDTCPLTFTCREADAGWACVPFAAHNP